MPAVSVPPLTLPNGSGPRRWVQLPRIPCGHVAASRAMILQAAGQAQPGSALILGAGPCREIPLAELARRFGQVTLYDQDGPSLADAVASARLSPEQAARVRTHVADLTGSTDRFLRGVAECLEPGSGLGAVAAIEHIARLAESEQPEMFFNGQRHDLIIASCVLCQLHLGACNGAIALFRRRFPEALEVYRKSEGLVRAIYGLARRMEATFLRSLGELLTPGGRIYLSDTVQMAFLYATPQGHWVTDGLYRMTRTPQLSDDLDPRYQVEQQGRWHWVMPPSSQPGGVGRLYNVQALTLSLPEAPLS